MRNAEAAFIVPIEAAAWVRDQVCEGCGIYTPCMELILSIRDGHAEYGAVCEDCWPRFREMINAERAFEGLMPVPEVER